MPFHRDSPLARKEFARRIRGEFAIREICTGYCISLCAQAEKPRAIYRSRWRHQENSQRDGIKCLFC